MKDRWYTSWKEPCDQLGMCMIYLKVARGSEWEKKVSVNKVEISPRENER